MIKVGAPIYPTIPKSKKYSYSDVKYDADGWASTSSFMPGEYDLVTILYKDGTKLSGWISGNTWDGLNVETTKDDNEVIAWKRLANEKQME